MPELIKQIFASMPEQARPVLQFWLVDTSPEAHFRRDPVLDQRIRDQFSSLWHQANAGELEYWLTSVGGRLAFVVLLDQLSRNMFRESPQAFALDHRALEVAKTMIASQEYETLPESWRSFCFMPLMHSENLRDQQQCVRAGKEILRDDGFHHYAVLHRDIIARFGRFPHRNSTLGRVSSDEELAFLQQPNSSF